MAQAVVIVGEKGQVLLPKILREEFGLYPGQHAIVQETQEGLLIKKTQEDPIKFFESLAQKFNIKKIKLHAYEDMYSERAKKAGINV